MNLAAIKLWLKSIEITFSLRIKNYVLLQNVTIKECSNTHVCVVLHMMFKCIIYLFCVLCKLLNNKAHFINVCTKNCRWNFRCHEKNKIK